MQWCCLVRCGVKSYGSCVLSWAVFSFWLVGCRLGMAGKGIPIKLSSSLTGISIACVVNSLELTRRHSLVKDFDK